MLDVMPYQREGASFLARSPHALLADEMGLGKTAQAICAADAVGAQRVLVVCPAAARVNWEREVARFSPFDHEVQRIESRSAPVAAGPGYVIVSFDLSDLDRFTRCPPWDVLIIDEAHFLKDAKSARTRAIYGKGGVSGIAAHARYVWRLTGTPMPNGRPSELWPHLRHARVAPHLTTHAFTDQFCEGYEGDYGFVETGVKNAPALRALVAPIMLRRTKKDVAMQLPPISFHDVPVPIEDVRLDEEFYEQMMTAGGEGPLKRKLASDDAVLRSIFKLSETTEKTLASETLAALEGLGTSMTTLRRWLVMAKLPAILRVLADELEADANLKLVLFAIHQCAIDGLRRGLGNFHPVTLYGGTPLDKRVQNIDRFQKDPSCRVFIGNIKAAGTAINLTAAHEVAFIEPSWVPGDNAQAAMRCHRIGQTMPVRVRFFIAAGTTDEHVVRIIHRKVTSLAKML